MKVTSALRKPMRPKVSASTKKKTAGAKRPAKSAGAKLGGYIAPKRPASTYTPAPISYGGEGGGGGYSYVTGNGTSGSYSGISYGGE